MCAGTTARRDPRNEIRDDGCGFDTQSRSALMSGHFGLAVMEESGTIGATEIPVAAGDGMALHPQAPPSRRALPRTGFARQQAGRRGCLRWRCGRGSTCSGTLRTGAEQQPGGKLHASGRLGPEELDPYRQSGRTEAAAILSMAETCRRLQIPTITNHLPQRQHPHSSTCQQVPPRGMADG